MFIALCSTGRVIRKKVYILTGKQSIYAFIILMFLGRRNKKLLVFIEIDFILMWNQEDDT